MKCPACRKRLSISNMLKLTNRYAKRVMTPCDHCSKLLILYKVSWRFVNVAPMLLIGMFLILDNNILGFGQLSELSTELIALLSMGYLIYVFWGLKAKLAKL